MENPRRQYPQFQSFQPGIVSPYTFKSNSQSFSFYDIFSEIIQFHQMLNGTSLIISSKNQKHLIISHHSKQGVLLKYYKINFWYRYEIPLVVTSDREVIWLDNQNNRLCQWNLQTYELLEVEYFVNQSDRSNNLLYYFPFKKLILIIEPGDQNSNFLRLTYYKYPFTSQSSPVFIYQNDQIWNYEDRIAMGNSKSMIITWFKNIKQENSISFKTFQLQQTKIGEYELIVQIYNNIKINQFRKGRGRFYIISNIWRMDAEKFFIHIKFLSQQAHIGNPACQNILLVYLESRDQIRYCHFFEQVKRDHQYMVSHNNGFSSAIYTVSVEQNEFKKSPVYYIDNLTQSIIYTAQWTYNSNVKIPKTVNCDPSTFVYNELHASKVTTNSLKVSLDVPNVPWKLVAAKTIQDMIGSNCDMALLEQTCHLLVKQKETFQNQMRTYYKMDYRTQSMDQVNLEKN